jgi:hypothetical protein
MAARNGAKWGGKFAFFAAAFAGGTSMPLVSANND